MAWRFYKHPLPVPPHHKGQICFVRAFKNRTNSVLISSEQKHFNLQPDLHQSTTTFTEYWGVLHLSEASEHVLQSEIAKSRGREENSVVCFHLYLMALTVQSLSPHANVVGSFRNDDGDGKREQRKSNRLNQAKQKFCTRRTLFCTFLCRHSTITKWNFLFKRRFMEELRKPKTIHLFFSF